MSSLFRKRRNHTINRKRQFLLPQHTKTSLFRLSFLSPNLEKVLFWTGIMLYFSVKNTQTHLKTSKWLTFLLKFSQHMKINSRHSQQVRSYDCKFFSMFAKKWIGLESTLSYVSYNKRSSSKLINVIVQWSNFWCDRTALLAAIVDLPLLDCLRIQ